MKNNNEANTPLFYVCSRHGNCGENVMFHGRDNRGYCTDLNKSHKFSLDEAQKMVSHDSASLPLLCSEVHKVSVIGVDHQYICEKEASEHTDSEFYIQINRMWDGNDIAFFCYNPKPTYNLKEAQVFTKTEQLELTKDAINVTVWPKSYIEALSRAVIKAEAINTKVMTVDAGIIYTNPYMQRV